jgi:hypothetical protein
LHKFGVQSNEQEDESTVKHLRPVLFIIMSMFARKRGREQPYYTGQKHQRVTWSGNYQEEDDAERFPHLSREARLRWRRELQRELFWDHHNGRELMKQFKYYGHIVLQCRCQSENKVKKSWQPSILAKMGRLGISSSTTSERDCKKLADRHRDIMVALEMNLLSIHRPILQIIHGYACVPILGLDEFVGADDVHLAFSGNWTQVYMAKKLWQVEDVIEDSEIQKIRRLNNWIDYQCRIHDGGACCEGYHHEDEESNGDDDDPDPRTTTLINLLESCCGIPRLEMFIRQLSVEYECASKGTQEE